MDKPLISCIVPLFNGKRFLAEALESIFDQSYRQLEIIVVDDGSTDGSMEVVGRYSSYVRYICGSNQGPAAARNRGLMRATGELVAFLDQDDLWHPRKLERQVSCFYKDPELSVCVTHVKKFQGVAQSGKKPWDSGHYLSKPLPGYLTGTLVARRSAFKTVGTFNSKLKYSDAAEWLLRASDLGVKIILLPDVLMYHRVHDDNFSRRHAAASREEFLKIIKGSLDRRRRAGESGVMEYNFPKSD